MSYNAKRRRLHGQAHHVVQARLRRDLSKLFALPLLPPDGALAPQPPGMLLNLFPYQLRSLARMIEIERGVELRLESSTGGTTEIYRPRGGVVADTVGLGKTAQIIGLLLSSPGPSGGTLVLTPEHLCHQWAREIGKFAGDRLRVRVATDPETLETAALAGFANSPVDVVVASLELLCSDAYHPLVRSEATATYEARGFHALRWHRIVLDECHDAVLKGGGAMQRVPVWPYSAAHE